MAFPCSQVFDNHGLTPLICACYESHCDCVKLLLAKVGDSFPFGFVRLVPPTPVYPQRLFVSEATGADEVTLWTKAPSTQRCGGCAGMSTEQRAHNAAPPLTCFVCSKRFYSLKLIVF